MSTAAVPFPYKPQVVTMDDRLTTVAFVTYRYATGLRRIGPMSLELAQPCAKDLAKRDGVADVRLEEWACATVRDVK